MNYQKIIKSTLRLQSKIIKACGREFGSLKSFNSKYSLQNIDYGKRIAGFSLFDGVKFKGKKDEVTYIEFNFDLIQKKGYGTHHSIVAKLIK